MLVTFVDHPVLFAKTNNYYIADFYTQQMCIKSATEKAKIVTAPGDGEVVLASEYTRATWGRG